LRVLDRTNTALRDREQPLRPTAAFRRRIAECRGDQPVLLHTIERRVQRTEHDLTPCRALDLAGDGGAVRLPLVHPQHRQQDHQLEVGEQPTRCGHMFSNCE
jgi:hypothetical protein